MDGQPGINRSEYPTCLCGARAFKDGVQGKAINTKLVYVGADVASRDITGTRIANMFLSGAGGECVRFRNRAAASLVVNSVIQWCGMLASGDDCRPSTKYHNSEGVYVGTSPKSTDQPLYANDTSNGIVVRNSTINTFGGECFDVKENAHHNRIEDSDCGFNDEPLSFKGSNIELRGDHNLIRRTNVHDSRSWNVKLASDSAQYDKGGNSIQLATSPARRCRAMRSEQSTADSRYCANTFAATPYVEGPVAIGDPRQSVLRDRHHAAHRRDHQSGRRIDGRGHGPDHRRRRRQRHREPRRVRRRRSADRHRRRRTVEPGLDGAQRARPAHDHRDGVRRRRQRRHRRGRRHGRHHHPAHLDQRRRHHDARADRADDRLRGGVGHPDVADGARLQQPAQGGRYVVQTSGSGTGRVTYRLTVPVAASYVLAFRAIAPSTSSDEFTYAVDGGSTRALTVPSSARTNWTWINGPTLNLSAGSHTLVVAKRENGVRLDAFTLTPPGAATAPSPTTTPTTTPAPSTTPTSTPPASTTTTTTPPPTTTTTTAPPPAPVATTPFEAEAGTVGTGMAVVADATASGGSYVVARSSGGTVRYTVSVPSRGTYMIAGWVKAPSSSADAFTVRLDSGSSAEWRLTQSRSWTYDAGSNPSFSLAAGTHTLTVGYREAGAAVDRLVLVRR